MKVYFRDTQPSVCFALEHAFDYPNANERISITCADIFSGDAVDCVVSPANSFGWMDGGIDAVYVRRFGPIIEANLKLQIGVLPFGELLVGQALCIETGDVDIPFMISAPTMRLPAMRLPGPTTSLAVFLAARAAFDLARLKNFNAIAVPGLGTWSGRVAPEMAAQAIREAYDAVWKPLKPYGLASLKEGVA